MKTQKLALVKSIIFSLLICLSIFLIFMITISDIQQEESNVIIPIHHRTEDISEILDVVENETNIVKININLNSTNSKQSVATNSMDDIANEKKDQLKQNMFIDLSWKVKIEDKISCLNNNRGGVYLFHMRKAAGTSLRTYLKLLTMNHQMSFHETEGKIINSNILKSPGIMSFTSLRHPVARIKSLYWYEHVEWYYIIAQNPSVAKSYKVWVDAWLDGSEWKNAFTAANPGNTYMEIENYYVKSLSGWKGVGNIGEEDLERAKEVLQMFDMVLITEWLLEGGQARMMDTYFKTSRSIQHIKDVKGNSFMKFKYHSFLARDEEEVDDLLRARNKYDILLYDYAQDLVRYRLSEMFHFDRNSSRVFDENSCPIVPIKLEPMYQKEMGVFRPPKHKGPLE
mmetsp:Transcript_10120/g.15134  ORF Transcript_10120/g.15134 Transcript_10120/m.15134 type:complete len:398 (+) Transcript_10120:56-1249(+)